VAVARELTKIYEEVFRGLLSVAVERFAGEVRGELTLVVEGAGEEAGRQSRADAPSGSPAWKDALEALLLKGLSSKEASSAIAARFNLGRKTVYQAALEMKKKG
jgi:16S rRNA (cytidine1402-2'-O)-methyltransferase